MWLPFRGRKLTELHWAGKLTQDGKKVAPLTIALPFQTIETVNESAQQRERTLELFSAGKRSTAWRNRLIWGDKKYVLPSLLPEFAGNVNLIYIDPPFDTGANFSFTATIPTTPGPSLLRRGETAPDPSLLRRGDVEDEETFPLLDKEGAGGGFPLGGGGLSFVKAPNMIEVKAYRDTWGKGLDSYLQWFYDTVVLLRELLAEDGSIYVHLDWHVGHYAKVVMDEVFGYENFRNEIIWKRSAIATNVDVQFRNSHDVILFYSKTQNNIFHVQYGEYSESSKKHFTYQDEKGIFQPVPLLGSGRTLNGETGQVWRGIDPNTLGKSGMHWLRKPAELEEFDKQGKIYWPSKGGVPRLKYYLSEAKGTYIPDLWTDINVINSMGHESVNYATQKPEALLERILKASSNAGDLVLDCFCGSGTTAAVAEKLGRRWITCDLGRFAIHTTRKRLLGIENVKPFIVQNLGKYERQQWMAAEFHHPPAPLLTKEGEMMSPSPHLRKEGPGAVSPHLGKEGLGAVPPRLGKEGLGAVTPHLGKEGAGGGLQKRLAIERQYRRFILDLYHAEPLDGHAWLHGAKAGRLVHIGTVDAPVTVEDIKQTIREFWKLVGKDAAAQTNGVDFLGWDFAFDVNETAKQFAASNRVDVKCKKIPHEVLEKKAIEQGDIRFYELAYLDAAASVNGTQATVALRNFIAPPDDVPPDIQRMIRHWSQWIDYWAIDWNYRDDTFHNEWQSYRTKARPELELAATHQYAEAGTYVVLVKVIDILGNDTTKAIEITTP